MISDAYVLVSCDAPGCAEFVEIALEFNYPDYSGRGGRYDHRPEKVLPKLKREGWTVIDNSDTEDGEHYCETCSAIRADDLDAKHETEPESEGD